MTQRDVTPHDGLHEDVDDTRPGVSEMESIHLPDRATLAERLSVLELRPQDIVLLTAPPSMTAAARHDLQEAVLAKLHEVGHTDVCVLAVPYGVTLTVVRPVPADNTGEPL